MRKPKFENALKLFEEERAALRTGAIEKISKIGAQRDAILADLEQMKLSRAQAETLKEKAGQNAKLLAAALAGIKDAQARLAALEEIRTGLNVYTATGDRATLARETGHLRHKV